MVCKGTGGYTATNAAEEPTGWELVTDRVHPPDPAGIGDPVVRDGCVAASPHSVGVNPPAGIPPGPRYGSDQVRACDHIHDRLSSGHHHGRWNMADRAVRDSVSTRTSEVGVRRFGPWIGIGLVGSIFRPGTSPPPSDHGAPDREPNLETATK